MVKIGKNSISGLPVPDILALENFGRESGFYKRQPDKITPTALFMSFWEMHRNGKNTLKNRPTNLGRSAGKTVTGQSLDGRINGRAVKLSKMVLKRALDFGGAKKGLKKKRKRSKIYAGFSTGFFSGTAPPNNCPAAWAAFSPAAIPAARQPPCCGSGHCLIFQKKNGGVLK